MILIITIIWVSSFLPFCRNLPFLFAALDFSTEISRVDCWESNTTLELSYSVDPALIFLDLTLLLLLSLIIPMVCTGNVRLITMFMIIFMS